MRTVLAPRVAPVAAAALGVATVGLGVADVSLGFAAHRQAGTVIGSAAFPVCIGVAVLKYRLYEIDRIISRVISYAAVTVLLAGVFAGLVLLATDVRAAG